MSQPKQPIDKFAELVRDYENHEGSDDAADDARIERLGHWAYTNRRLIAAKFGRVEEFGE